MPTTSLYCSQCATHTPHIQLSLEYATACTKCGAHTSQLVRLQSTSTPESIKAPDGTDAEVVDNTQHSITFYIPKGAHKGYYDYDKHTGKKTIRS